MSTSLTEEEEQEMYDQFNKMDLNDKNARKSGNYTSEIFITF